MKRLLSRFWVIIGFAVLNALGALRFALEVIGYATLPDDAKEAHGLLKVLADMALALPWWAIWWPLMASYVFAAGIAFDFSFDIFNRAPKVLPQTKLDRLLILSNNFLSRFAYLERESQKFFSDHESISAMSEIEIFQERLVEFGVVPPIDNGDMVKNILVIKALIARYKPYLEQGRYDKAISVANEASDSLS